VKWYVPAGALHRLSQPFNPSAHRSFIFQGMETDMCGPENRTELPLASAATGCACCSTEASTPSAASGSSGTEFAVEGLTCGHCVQTVQKAVSALEGVESASVDLVPGGRSRLTVAGKADNSAVREAVTSAGYTLISN
jgi:copper chaperone